MIAHAICFAIVGAGFGYLISKHIGRFTGGSCPILCNPKISIPYFAFLGLLLGLELFT